MLRIVAIVAAVSASARAEPPLRFGAANLRVAIEHATIAVDGAQVTLTLKLTSETRDRAEGEVAIDVPHGARVVGMTLRSGGLRMVARSIRVDEARERYRTWSECARDPALLEWGTTDGERDRFRLRVFPVALHRSATVEIRFELLATRLVVDPEAIDTTLASGAASRELRRPRAIAVAASAGPSIDAVDATHALYADDAPIETPPPRLAAAPRNPSTFCLPGQ